MFDHAVNSPTVPSQVPRNQRTGSINLESIEAAYDVFDYDAAYDDLVPTTNNASTAIHNNSSNNNNNNNKSNGNPPIRITFNNSDNSAADADNKYGDASPYSRDDDTKLPFNSYDTMDRQAGHMTASLRQIERMYTDNNLENFGNNKDDHYNMIISATNSVGLDNSNNLSSLHSTTEVDALDDYSNIDELARYQRPGLEEDSKYVDNNDDDGYYNRTASNNYQYTSSSRFQIDRNSSNRSLSPSQSQPAFDDSDNKRTLNRSSSKRGGN